MTTPQPPLPPLPFDGENPWGTKFRIWSTALREWIHGKADRDHTHMIDGIPGLSSVLNNKANRDDMMAGMGIIEAADTELKDLKSNVLPELRHEVDLNNLVLEDLNVNVIPAVQQELDQAKQTLSDATLWIDETGRQLDTNLEEARGKLSELEDTVLPNLEDRLGVSETNAAQAKAAADAAVKNTVVEYAKSTSRSTPPSTGWSTSTPTMADNEYAWMRSVITYGNDSTSTTSAVLVTGNTGAKGEPGRGIESSTVEYALSASSVSAPSSGWSSTVPTVPAGQFLWTRTTFEYTAGSPTTAYSVARQGANGSSGQTSYLHTAYANSADGATDFSTTDPSGRAYLGTYTSFTPEDSTLPASYTWVLIKGATGDAGKGISSSVVSYQSSSSGTTTPTGTWVSSVPSVPKGHYLWTRTVLSFTDGASTTTYSVGGMGQDGASGSDGRGIVGTVVTYLVGSSGTTPPSGTWTSSVPTSPQGQFLWTRSITSYTTGSPTTAYSVSRAGEDGSNGQTSYLHTAYATNATGTAGFSTTDANGKTYLGTYTDFVEADSTDPSKYTWVLIKGATGDDGKGVSSIVEQYYLSTSATSQTGGSWVTTPPAWVNGRYMWTRSVITYTDSSTSQTSPVNVTGSKGEVGDSGRSITSVDVQYYSSTSSTSQTGGSWSTTTPAWVDGRYIWSKTVTTYSSGSPTETAPVVITGGRGATGPTGKGIQSSAVHYQASGSGTTVPTGSWQGTVPSVTAGQYLWTRTTITFTDGATQITYSTSRQGSDGAQGVSITSVTPFFQLVVTGSAAPAQPSGTANPSGWVATEPNYQAQRELYRTERVLYSNSTATWSPVTKVASYTGLATLSNVIDANKQVVDTLKDTTLPALEDQLGRRITAVSQRGMNYITNGFGELGDTTNFAWGPWIYHSDDSPIGALGSFSVGSTYIFAPLDESIPVDASVPLLASLAVKQVNVGVTSRIYFAISPLDAYGKSIQPQNYMEQSGTRTTLAQALNPGDTEIHLVSSSGWTNSVGAAASRRSLIAWNYIDQGGRSWPPGTYSRNTWLNIWDDGAISGNVITLRNPWAGPAIPVDTVVGNGSAGGTYMYASGISNALVPSDGEWHTLSATMPYVGIHTNLATNATSMWPAATAKALVRIGLNAGVSGGTSLQRISAISLSPVAAANTQIDQIGVVAQLADKRLTISEDAPSATTGYPLGAHWTRVDAQNREIGYWRLTATGWVAMTMDPVVIPNLSAGKITSGTIDTARLNAQQIATAVATIIELNADRITSGTVNTARLNAEEIAAVTAQFINLDVSQLTASGASIGTAVVEKLWTEVVRAKKITTDMLTADSVTADKIAAGQVQTNHMVVNTINGDRIILNTLDGDKIKANSIKSEKILANSIAADRIVANEEFYARFLQAENLRAGTGVFNAAFADAIWTNIVRSRKITTDMMTVGNGDNLLPDPDIQVADAWGHSNAWISTTGAYLRGGSITVPASTTQYGNYSASNSMYNIPVVGDDSYRVVGWAKPASDVTAAGHVSLYLQARDASHAVIGTQLVASNTVAVAANTWTKLSGVGKVPMNTAYVSIGTYVQAAHNGAVTFSDLSVTKATSSSLIVDGSVTAAKMNFVSGNPADGVIEIDNTGLKGWSPGQYGVSYAEPAIELSNNTTDAFQVRNKDGETVAGMDISGVIAGTSASLDSLEINEGHDYYTGNLVQEVLPNMPRGHILYAQQNVRDRTVSVTSVDNAYLAFLEFRLEVEAGRTYRIEVSGPSIYIPPGVYGSAWIWYTYDGTKPTFNSLLLGGSVDAYRHRNLSSRDITFPKTTFYHTPSSSRTDRFLVGMAGSSNSASQGGDMTVFSSDSAYCRVWVDDMGIRDVSGNQAVNRTDYKNSAALPVEPTPPPPAVSTYTKTYTASSVQSYKWDDSKYTWVKSGVEQATKYAFQGAAPSGYGSTITSGSRSVWIFPSWASTLSGATVTKVRLYLKNEHSASSAGLTAQIRSHTHTGPNAPSTLASWSTNSKTQKFAKGASGWVTLTDVGNIKTALASSIKGFGLNSNEKADYGYFAKAAKLEVTYKK